MINYGTSNEYPEQIAKAFLIPITTNPLPIPPSYNSNKIAKLKILADKLETRKSAILSSFYKTGRIDGLYFGRSSKSKRNHVKEYIKSCLYKCRINDMTLIDDCYNEMFLELTKKNAATICAIYDEAPAKLLATALRIIALKCFAKDPRYNNPNHSLVQKTIFASITSGASTVDHTEEYKERNIFGDNCSYENQTTESKTILHSNDEAEEFVRQYGFSPEQIVERLPYYYQLCFYDAIGKQPRGKTPADVTKDREELAKLVVKIREELQRNE